MEPRQGTRKKSGGKSAPSALSWLIPLSRADLPSVQRLILEAYKLSPSLWIKHLCLKIFLSLLPAFSLYYSGQLFSIVSSFTALPSSEAAEGLIQFHPIQMQVAVEKREIDQFDLIKAFTGAAICTLLSRLSTWLRYENELNILLDRYFGDRIIRAKACLDVPTSTDVPTLAKLSHFRSGGRSPGHLIATMVSFGSILIQLTSQVWVLLHLLKSQPDSVWLVIGSFADPIVGYLKNNSAISYAVNSKHREHRRETMSMLVEPRRSAMYRQEIVVNNLADYITESYNRAATEGQPQASSTVWNRYKGTSYQSLVLRLIQDLAAEGPRVLFALKALNTPTHIPLSLATLEFVQGQVRTFTNVFASFTSTSGSLQTQITAIKDLYQLDKLPNIIKDGYKDLHCGGEGVSVEFDSVSFKYSGQDTHALRNISFKLAPGDLCVIVGANGQGKSSILKLMTRLHDATEGTIRVQDEPIQNYLLSHLRRITSVLFQDFATFPVSIEENIRMGDSSTALLEFDAEQEHRVHRAAELGGAAEFVSKLPRGFKTNFAGEGESWESVGPDGHDILLTVSQARQAAERNKERSLSGGQSQRLALARTFMKPSEDVSLLIYDEPSASLDPQAEYDLFERLKALRGSKTMIFSTHRFGYLTKHADVILYMKDSTIVESGTHAQLMAQDGGYAHLYKLQASAFA